MNNILTINIFDSAKLLLKYGNGRIWFLLAIKDEKFQ